MLAGGTTGPRLEITERDSENSDLLLSWWCGHGGSDSERQGHRRLGIMVPILRHSGGLCGIRYRVRFRIPISTLVGVHRQ